MRISVVSLIVTTVSAVSIGRGCFGGSCFGRLFKVSVEDEQFSIARLLMLINCSRRRGRRTEIDC